MKTFTLNLTQQEVEVVMTALNSAQTRGVEASRLVVSTFDKIAAQVQAPKPEQPKPNGAEGEVQTEN